MKDFFSKLKFIVLLVCLILAILSSLAIYFINGNLIEKKDEKEVKGQSLEKIRSADESLRKRLNNISFEISNYDIDENLTKRKNKLAEDKQQLDSEKESLDEEDKRLKDLKSEIDSEKKKLSERLAKIGGAEKTVSDADAALDKEIKALGENPAPEKLKELENKKKALEPQKTKNKNDRNAYNKDNEKLKQKDNSYKEDLKKFNTRNQEYKDKLSDYTSRKNKFDKDFERENKKLEELRQLREKKTSIEKEIFSNDAERNKLESEYNDLDAEINSLSNLKLILFVVVLLLIILSLIILIFQLKQIKPAKRQVGKHKTSFNDPYELKQNNANSRQTNTGLSNEDVPFDFGESQNNNFGEMSSKDIDARFTNFGSNYEYLSNKIYDLEKRIATFERRLSKLEENLSKLQVTSSVGMSGVRIGSEEKKIVRENQLPKNTITNFYSSKAKRENRPDSKYDTYLKIDEAFYNLALDRQGEGEKATLTLGGEFISAEFILIEGNLLYFNFYCYNEKKVFPKCSVNDMKIRKYIFDFDGDEHGRIIQCSPARVKKIAEGKYEVIDKGSVLMQNEI